MRTYPWPFVAVLASLNGGCVGVPAPPPRAEMPPPRVYAPHELRDLTAVEKKALAQTLPKSFKDPESARFRWGKVPKEPDANGIASYCAMVNAKNSFGGYTGFKPFMAVIVMKDGKITDGTISVAGSTETDNAIIEKMCADKGLRPYDAV